MNIKPVKLIALMFIFLIVSCDEPETVVTNYVHPDGSVTRTIEMRSNKNKFDSSVIQVPFDSSWTISDSIVINEKGDTTFIKKCEKLFVNAEAINKAYATDSGANRNLRREASFKRRFRWFNTVYIFSEKIDRTISTGYPIKDFLNKDELSWFYSPGSLKLEKQGGPDSLKYKTLNDTVEKKVDFWTMKNLVSDCIMEFDRLTSGNGANANAVKALKSREDEIVKLTESTNAGLDSLWLSGALLREFIGDSDALKYKREADSAISLVSEKLNRIIDFKEYSTRIVMPGEMINMNGFVDSSAVLVWPVRSDYFLTEPYIMWAESKTPNSWAWIVSGLFLIFVLTGVIISKKKRLNHAAFFLNKPNQTL